MLHTNPNTLENILSKERMQQDINSNIRMQESEFKKELKKTLRKKNIDENENHRVIFFCNDFFRRVVLKFKIIEKITYPFLILFL